ncbi:1-acyl-sn-glycerol-3-phosphate acyltransferase [Sphingobacterium bambusae]|uniref:1-acyl-sn-glycerol-3-phosphate acyltransferase n=2 Tax=Sphingobacterium bambusae TaxID=662858 RepID=A0ABW6BDK2_9SPHI|nr:1-acyl-sn-glycerol-3-phosphate acyltransferase [Sphingobacterium bambusae]WPL50753.1 1-acyl-sn-glycerol-3-phosphate acyltransferase [Sphingobacterium bambusae]
MERMFYHIYLLVQRYKLLSCSIALAFLVGCGFLASKIRFEEDITQIIPKNDDADELSRAIKQMNFADKITVLLEKTDTVSPQRLSAMATAFVDSLARDTVFVKGISGQVGQQDLEDSYNFVYRNLPFFLDSTAYAEMEKRFSPDSIAVRMAQNYRTLLSPTGFVTSRFIQKDPLGLGFLGLEKIRQQGIGDQFILMDGFVASSDSSKILLFVDPIFRGADTEHNTRFVDHLETIREKLEKQFLGQSLSYYGSTFVAVANAKQIKTDISTTVLLSMSILMVLLVLFYKRIYIPVLVFIPTIFAVALSLACLYLYKPIISAISLSVAAVLLGITIDYSLHVLTHFKKSGDVRALYKELTRPLLMSGATNAVAFLCLLFVHSSALIDLGIFASICIFSSSVFTLLLIPHLYRPREAIRYNSLIDKIAGFSFERSKPLIAMCVLLLLISCFTSGRVGYNNNLASLNFVPKALRETEVKLDTLLNTSSKSLYLVSSGESFDEAARKADSLFASLERAKASNQIIHYTGLTMFPLSSEAQASYLQRWDKFWNIKRRNDLREKLVSEGEKYGFSPHTHDMFYERIAQQHTPMGMEEIMGAKLLSTADFLASRDSFYTISTLVKVAPEKRDQFLKQIDKTNDVLVIDRQHLNEHFLGQLRDDFNRLVGYSFFAVLLILWVFFRRVELVLLSAVPIALTGLVTTGLMGLLGLEFNIFSAIVCTLVFGHGVDFSIFMTAALQKQYSTGEDELQTYRTSILLAVLTTVLAIGALVFAKHPALLSIASVSLIGVFAAVIITFVFYPILFRFFISNRAKQGKSPFTVSIAFFSMLFFLYYGLGTIILSFLCRTALMILPISRARKDHIFRRMMALFMKSVLCMDPRTKHKNWNEYRETFDRPAVVIANHSSFLDTLSMGMLVPKGIFLVNDWVWNSPIFGRAVKALGFYPVSKGLDNGVDVLREKVKNGYSLIVFPEGTRSYDNVVKRFHKGAFFLAQEFDLDVVPVYLLGNGDVLPKGDILIFGGALNPVIGERIGANDTNFGVDYGSRTKQITQHYRSNYEKLRHKFEGVHYFSKKIVLAYLFKDEEIVDAVKRHINAYATHYHSLRDVIAAAVKINHLSDSYGEFDYLLSLQKGQRKVVGIIADAEKRAVAESIYWRKHRQVNFTETMDAADNVLVVHPTLLLSDFQVEKLSFFQEIYTFKEEPLLDRDGWKAVRLSEFVIRYVR